MGRRTNTHKGIAKRLLTHYFQLALESAGVSFGPDLKAEIGNIVDVIFDEIEDVRKEHAPRSTPMQPPDSTPQPLTPAAKSGTMEAVQQCTQERIGTRSEP